MILRIQELTQLAHSNVVCLLDCKVSRNIFNKLLYSVMQSDRSSLKNNTFHEPIQCMKQNVKTSIRYNVYNYAFKKFDKLFSSGVKAPKKSHLKLNRSFCISLFLKEAAKKSS